MANLTPPPGWDDVPQLEEFTLALGGPSGPMNAQAKALAARTEHLKAESEDIRLDLASDLGAVMVGTSIGATVESVLAGISLGSSEMGPDIPVLGAKPSAIPNRVGHSARRPWMSTHDLAFYINPTTGADTNDGLTQGTALRTYAEAMNRVPYLLYHAVRIYCLDGVYNEVPITQFIWMSSSRWSNFMVIGHTPNNPAYTDTKPENVVFSHVTADGRTVTTWSAMPGSNFNTTMEGVTIDAFWPYSVTCELIDCIIQNGGGATNNYGVGGHGGRVNFKRVKFKNLPADGLVCEATDFARFHFDECTLDNVLAPIASVKNQSVATFEACGFDLSTSYADPSSFLMGDRSVHVNQFGMGGFNKPDGFVALSAGDVGSGSDSYNDGGQVVCFGKDVAGSNGGAVVNYFGSRTKALTSSKYVVAYADLSGSKEVFRVNPLGLAKPSVGVQFNAVTASATSGFNNSLFVDSADNKLKFRDSTGTVRVVTVS